MRPTTSRPFQFHKSAFIFISFRLVSSMPAKLDIHFIRKTTRTSWEPLIGSQCNFVLLHFSQRKIHYFEKHSYYSKFGYDSQRVPPSRHRNFFFLVDRCDPFRCIQYSSLSIFTFSSTHLPFHGHKRQTKEKMKKKKWNLNGNIYRRLYYTWRNMYKRLYRIFHCIHRSGGASFSQSSSSCSSHIVCSQRPCRIFRMWEWINFVDLWQRHCFERFGVFGSQPKCPVAMLYAVCVCAVFLLATMPFFTATRTLYLDVVCIHFRFGRNV